MEIKQKNKYLLAKAYRRIFSRILDSTLCLAIIFGLDILIIATDPVGIKNATELAQTWRYALCTIISLAVLSMYFILLPLLTNGRTLFMYAFKTRTYTKSQGSLFYKLFKKELFFWFLLSIVNLSLGIILAGSSPNKANDLLRALMNLDNSGDNFNNIICAFYATFYSFYAGIIILILINTVWQSKKATIVDRFSDTIVIWTIPANKYSLNKEVVRNSTLPGDITNEVRNNLEEL